MTPFAIAFGTIAVIAAVLFVFGAIRVARRAEDADKEPNWDV